MNVILSARDLRSLTSIPGRAIDEHVAHCAACDERTPHARVLRRRPVLLLLSLVSSAAALIAGGGGMALWVPALLFFWWWALLRSSDRRGTPRCVRCLDRSRRDTGTYMIDIPV